MTKICALPSSSRFATLFPRLGGSAAPLVPVVQLQNQPPLMQMHAPALPNVHCPLTAPQLPPGVGLLAGQPGMKQLHLPP